MSVFADWLCENEDNLRERWAEKLSYMGDSSEHILMLSRSDKAFTEFCADEFENALEGPEPDDVEGA